MRVVIIADMMDTGFGGMKTYAENLVRYVSEVDRTNEYFVINFSRSEIDRNVTFIGIPYTRYTGKFFIRKFWQIPNKLRSINPDVVLETTHIGPFFLPKRVRRITVIHDLSTFIQPDHYTWINRLAERLLLPGVIKRADHLITVSESTKKDIQNIFKVPSNQLTVIPLSVEDIFQPTVEKGVLQKYGINNPYLLHVGTIQPRKNIVMLVEAYEQFRMAVNREIQLVIVGKIGWKSDEVLQKMRNSPYAKDIIETGYVPKVELPVFYSMCKLFVFPSHYEGFGLPLLEALACGAKCIAADNSSLREVGGTNVTYVKLNSPEDLSNKIIQCLFTKEEVSPTKVDNIKELTWRQVTKKTLDLLCNQIHM